MPRTAKCFSFLLWLMLNPFRWLILAWSWVWALLVFLLKLSWMIVAVALRMAAHRAAMSWGGCCGGSGVPEGFPGAWGWAPTRGWGLCSQFLRTFSVLACHKVHLAGKAGGGGTVRRSMLSKCRGCLLQRVVVVGTSCATWGDAARGGARPCRVRQLGGLAGVVSGSRLLSEPVPDIW